MPTTRDLDAELDERLQRFAAKGMSRAGMLAQLNLAGYPIAKLRERFPEFSDVAFGLTPPITPRSATAARAEGGAPEVSSRAVSRQGQPRASLQGRIDGVPERGTSGTAPVARAAVREAEEGISFHYVPLIQCSFPHADPGESRSFTRRNGWLELTLGTT